MSLLSAIKRYFYYLITGDRLEHYTFDMPGNNETLRAQAKAAADLAEDMKANPHKYARRPASGSSSRRAGQRHRQRGSQHQRDCDTATAAAAAAAASSSSGGNSGSSSGGD